MTPVTATASTAVIREQVKDLKRQLNDQRKETADLKLKLAEDPTPTVAQQLARSANAETSLQNAIEELRDEEQEMLKRMDNGSGAGAVDLSGLLGDRLSDPSFMADLARRVHTTQRIDVDLGDVDREVAMGWTGSRLAQVPAVLAPTPGMRQVATDRIVSPMVPTRWIDMIASFPLDAPSFLYAREVSAPGAPAPTAPLAIKPQIGFTYEDVEAVPATVAGWLKMARQTGADQPMLWSHVGTRLPQRVRDAIEYESLSGTGAVSDQTGKPGIVGLLNTSGVAQETVAAGGLVADQIIEAIADVLMVGATPNVCALHPRDWAALMTTKAQGSGEYVCIAVSGHRAADLERHPGARRRDPSGPDPRRRHQRADVAVARGREHPDLRQRRR